MTEQLQLESGEDIVRVVRKHWFILFAKTIGIIVVAFLPIALVITVFSSDTLLGTLPEATPFEKPAIFFATAWLLLSWMALFTAWTDYYLDAWIITDRRVIAIDQRGFFNRQVSSFRLERMQNVTVVIDGLLHTLLDFGNIDADTAGHEHFIIRGIPNPRNVKALIQASADTRMRMAPASAIRPTGMEV